MRLAEDYIRLREAFPDAEDGQKRRVTMEEIAQAFCCTPRNAKLILAKMEKQQWLHIVPGRGRGHASELTFYKSRDQLAVEAAQEVVKQGSVQEALVWLREHAGAEARAHFMEWLSRYFGYEAAKSADDGLKETLRLPVFRPIVTLDPADAFYGLDVHLIKQIHGTLVDYDGDAERVKKGLAHHWDKNQEATCWTFYLRKGVLFHNGAELTAEDVVYTLTRLQAGSYSHSWLCRDVQQVRAESRYCVTVVLRQANYMFDVFMSHTGASIIPRGSGGHTEEAGWTMPAGAGPYLVAMRMDGMIVLEAFTSYYAERGLMDQIEIIRVPESESELALQIDPGIVLVQTGEGSVQQFREAARQQQRYLTGCAVLIMNMRREGGVLSCGTLRQALVHGVDRQRLADELGYPHAGPAAGFLLEIQSGDSDGWYEPELAAAKLLESGYTGNGGDGEPVLRLFAYERHARTAYWLQRAHAELGVRLEVEIRSWGDMMNPAVRSEADLILFEAVLRGGLLRQLEYLLSANSFLRSAMTDELQALVDGQAAELVKEADPAERMSKFKTLESRLGEACAAVYLTCQGVSALSHPTLQDVKFNPLGWVDFKDIWVKGTAGEQQSS
ncbi:ABC transporter substrate-binding protein [Paenibacillus tarimensis]|uniref:ABC transporter substrate-binding protein n=1 Tax=Paenibacillus tarimensis TaxID=416012 RepID=UPI001F332C27|nr:ABC transporter substrate-binding protein [Paenibacillus tarimensis]MCF2943382.1 ABC transporter substrate-binding protein [Paenibacillus tarimensis]